MKLDSVKNILIPIKNDKELLRRVVHYSINIHEINIHSLNESSFFSEEQACQLITLKLFNFIEEIKRYNMIMELSPLERTKSIYLQENKEKSLFWQKCPTMAADRSFLVVASSVFRLCISTSFWLMIRLSRPISSVFSESDFSSLRRRWLIKRKASSISVHCLAIPSAKINIFHRMTKCVFTSLNSNPELNEIATSPLVDVSSYKGHN